MTVRKIWKSKYIEPTEQLIQSCGNNRILASLLSTRGINTPEKAAVFLNPLKAVLSSPDVFNDMEKAYHRIKTAIDNKEHITIYGDFDADGVTSTSLLYLTLKELGADADFYLPDRNTESHGLNTKALVQIIAKKKTKLIITVDCGISNIAEVNFAKGFKADVIITDHHEAPEQLPDAYAILNPKAPNSLSDKLDVEELQSLNYLAGVGVAFKLACKLLKEYNKENFVHKILPLAAIGTIGDVVELIGENRSIVSMGIEIIRNSGNKGITKMLKSAGIEDITNVTSENIAFAAVPRINAAGRLDSPDTAIQILISDDDEEINEHVKTLNELNTLRQDLCDKTFEEAKSMYLSDLTNNKKSIILLNEKWHIGIIGIVASKLVEAFNKPVFLMTKDVNTPNIIRCSCRSIPDLNIHAILSNHKEIFEGFGGHKMAAGFSFDENKTSFESFKKMLAKTIEEYAQDINFNEISVDFDMYLNPEDITEETLNQIEKLQPYGSANPSPVFAMEHAILNNFKMMGQENNHLKMFISKNNSAQIECIKWNCPNFSAPLNSELDILFTLKLNTFNNIKTVQLIAEDINSEFINSAKNDTGIKILDHRNKKNIINQVLDFISTTKKKTAVFVENPALINQIKTSTAIENKLFSRSNIPDNIEQLMFFDVPSTKEQFFDILKDTGANLVHLMNFNINEINADSFITKLSGMLNYSVSNLKGEIDLTRISKALGVTNDTVECALTIFDDIEMIDLNKIDETNYKITYVHPIELSKVKEHDIYMELTSLINEMNDFRQFYLNSSIEEIKELIQC